MFSRMATQRRNVPNRAPILCCGGDARFVLRHQEDDRSRYPIFNENDFCAPCLSGRLGIAWVGFLLSLTVNYRLDVKLILGFLSGLRRAVFI